ncbi:N-glycosylation protein-domain-containing protein [Nemania sp. FL0031]|nr:N-glycosylation protein-domain-containing protein [Nemania sp. FL0031]
MHKSRPSPSLTRPDPNPNTNTNSGNGATIHALGHSPDYTHTNHTNHHSSNYNSINNKIERPVPAVTVSLLQPRVAVLLGLPKRWYRTLSICRLLCLVPCFWWGLRIALRFLVAQVLQRTNRDGPDDDASLWLTETLLAALWCLASATLAFYFTDCLMSRWLINYTPQATVVRLLTISCVFAYLTSWVVHVTGGSKDPRLLLPAWICIATILTACYHYTQRKVPIRKETFASMSVFSIASFISMLALLLDINTTRSFPETQIPLVSIVKTTAGITGRIVVKILGVNKDGIGR